MKPNLSLISLTMLGLSVISCEQNERSITTNSNDAYEEAFVKAFGNYSKTNTWNAARQFSLEIIPGAGGRVKIYAPCHEGFRLVASYSRARGPFTSIFDAPDLSEVFIVALDDELYYAIPGGGVSLSSQRADDADISDEPLQWILAVENDFDAKAKARRGADGIDFDFNDLLIGITSVVTDDGVSLEFLPLACGDNQPFYLHIKTNEGDQLLWQANDDISDDCEYHQWFGIKDFNLGVNTGTNASDQTAASSAFYSTEAIAAAMSGSHITLPSYWTLSDYSHISHNYKGQIEDLWGIYITVGTYKGEAYVKDNPDYGLICSEGAGAAPRMLLFPDAGQSGEWRWPCEGNNIGACYPTFKDWLKEPDNPQYASWYEWMFMPGLVRERF